MSSPFFHKPELALRRALELESIKQEDAALQLLHEILASRRHRTWSPTYEAIMMTYLNLCLKLHKSREAKDGLHQYRNLSQSQAPGSLEKVIRYLMEQAEQKCTAAKIDADALPDNDQDEAILLLSSMSADPLKTQRDSALLLPSLKFLWETYRAVLDILKSNSKLEHVYHAAAMGALRFCRTYKRRTEFRRLCDMLRMHLGNLQKYGSLTPVTEADNASGKGGNGKIRGWEGWTTESIELHLQTRFSQLETASVLHLYTEGFRTVEDIYNILQISHARRKTTGAPPPKAKLMAAYYEKLTTLFWVSENYLFHAFAWYKYYSLCKEYNRGMSDEMKQMQASAVLLATLCIPAHDAASPSAASGSSNSKSSQQQQGHGISSTLEDDIIKEKMARMATLLGFHTRHPTREALLSEIRSNNNNIMESVPSYLRDLYLLLEENSDPLIMVEQAKPLLEQLKKELGATNETDNDDFDDNTLGRYVKPLTDVLLLKLLLNLSAAYHTVSMDHLKRLTEGLGVTFDQVEKAIVLFTQQTKTVSVRIDHRAGCLRFGDPELESEQMRSQLTTLSKKLQTLVDTTIAPSADSSASRSAFYESIRSKLVSEHEAILERKNLIESKKEEVERVAQEALREANRIKEVEAAARKVEEDKRLQREQRVREKEKMRKIQMEMEATEKKKYLQAMGRNIESMTEEEVANIDTAALAKEHADKANKKREDAERKQREAAKRLDYLVRAVRIEELPLIEKKYDEKIASDRARYEADVVEKAKRAKEQWLADVKEKEALNVHSVFKYLDAFEDLSMVGRKKMHRELCKAEDQRAEMDSEKGKLDRARSRKDEEEKMRAAEEAKIRAEEEAVQLVEEKARRDEEKRRKAAEEEKRRQAELSRMQDERDRKENERRPPPGSRQLDAAQGGGGYKPPSMRGGGGGGSRMGGGSDRLDRGGGYGGGRYEGRQQGDGDRGGSGDGGGSHWGTGGGDRGGGDRDRRGGGDSYGARRDDRGGSSSGGGGAWRK